MRADELRTLFDYYYWVTGKILDAVVRATPVQWAGPPPLGAWGVRETLVHALDMELAWWHAWADTAGYAPLDPAAFPDVATLAARWRDAEAGMRTYLAGLDDAAALRSHVGPGGAGALTRGDVIAHLAHHGMQHRSEAALLLTHLGHSPGKIDMLYWLDERAARRTGAV